MKNYMILQNEVTLSDTNIFELKEVLLHDFTEQEIDDNLYLVANKCAYTDSKHLDDLVDTFESMNYANDLDKYVARFYYMKRFVDNNKDCKVFLVD